MIRIDDLSALVGRRVLLCPPPDFPDDGPEEGTLLSADGPDGPAEFFMVVVQVDECHQMDPTDDCLRECSWDQVTHVMP